jgi:DNA-binding MarR family transcriptional regulator
VEKHIIDILNALSERLKVRVLTPEHEIALFLIDRASATTDELLRNSSLSSTGFYNTLDRLKHWGVVVFDQSPTDKRSKLYRLSGHARRQVLLGLGRYLASRIEAASLVLPRSDLPSATDSATGEDRLNYLTCEYQILLHLRVNPAMRNSELAQTVDASDTKFNISLAHLVRLGLVEFDHDPEDKRRKNYRISDEARCIMDDTYEKLMEWLAATDLDELQAIGRDQEAAHNPAQR